MRVVPGGRWQQCPVSNFVVSATAGSAAIERLVFVIVWRRHLLVRTSNGRVGSPTIGTCERLFASVAPL